MLALMNINVGTDEHKLQVNVFHFKHVNLNLNFNITGHHKSKLSGLSSSSSSSSCAAWDEFAHSDPLQWLYYRPVNPAQKNKKMQNKFLIVFIGPNTLLNHILKSTAVGVEHIFIFF